MNIKSKKDKQFSSGVVSTSITKVLGMVTLILFVLLAIYFKSIVTQGEDKSSPLKSELEKLSHGAGF